MPAKTETTMAHFNESDIPFQRALAGAYTICDNYFCSIQGPTTPNRLYLWTGTIDPDGTQGGPATFNPADYNPVYSWPTYPERLQTAGVSWQVYANHEVGDQGGADGWVGDFGDNPLWLFQAYHQALASSDPKVRQLAERAAVIKHWLPNSGLGHRVDHVLQQFISDCQAGTLPDVSWIVAPYQWCEHPTARPADGAVYQQRVIQALWENPRLWESTVLFINYDENDGLFDHILPPLAPPGTPEERLSLTGTVPTPGQPTAPIGLGPRVPMTVVSPWSRGGWVNSQVHDHTSVLRFLEAWTGVREPNISAWRRAICGDLTGCFDFAHPTFSPAALPSAKAFQSLIDRLDNKLPAPTPPPDGRQEVPAQDPGPAQARPLPYQALANVDASGGASGSSSLMVAMENAGTAGLQLNVWAGQTGSPPQFIDLPANGSITTSLVGPATYDVWVHGPNGFLRNFRGDAASTAAGVEVTVTLTGRASHPLLLLTIINGGHAAVHGGLSGAAGISAGTDLGRISVSAKDKIELTLDPLATSEGWYDLTVTIDGLSQFLRRFAGHLEDGRPSVTG